ncbi:hypothetical protein BQ8794_80127 [Mesorhizobium prunaredense]|uniref:Uncharacterized protein n=1 Tax=Mesorhizobium prunaredense TaxID=1631249 RepID=A0A1R3VIZ6_9HYPH|nr:hypothetical protein BQ8794_80127 [Mesorhizobium prunaredense]
MQCRTFDRGGTAPPSVLPDISPTWGEIGSFADSVLFARLVVGEISDEGQSPSLWGRCRVLAKRAGQRGARRIATERFYSEPPHSWLGWALLRCPTSLPTCRSRRVH